MGLYDYLLDQLGDEESVKLAFTFDELGRLFDELNLQPDIEDISAEYYDDIVTYLSGLVDEMNEESAEVMIHLNEMVRHDSKETTGIGFSVSRF